MILKKYKIWFADEIRFGLMTNEKRSWNKVGERTRLPNQLEYANRYLYSAVSPVDGDSVHVIGFSVKCNPKMYQYAEVKCTTP